MSHDEPFVSHIEPVMSHIEPVMSHIEPVMSHNEPLLSGSPSMGEPKMDEPGGSAHLKVDWLTNIHPPKRWVEPGD